MTKFYVASALTNSIDVLRDTFYDALSASGSDVTIEFIADIISQADVDAKVKQRLINALGFVQLTSDDAVRTVKVSSVH